MCSARWAPKSTVATKSKRMTGQKLNAAWPQHGLAHRVQEVTMPIDAILLLIMGVMFAAAIYLLMDRTLTRILFGLMMFTNAANLLLIILSVAAGRSPISPDA